MHFFSENFFFIEQIVTIKISQGHKTILMFINIKKNILL